MARNCDISVIYLYRLSVQFDKMVKDEGSWLKKNTQLSTYLTAFTVILLQNNTATSCVLYLKT